MPNTDARSTINDLLQICKDGQEGFSTAAEKVTAPEVKMLFRDYARQRELFVGELETAARSLGETPNGSGSVTGALHRGWINLRGVLSGNDEHAILAECERGEDSAVEAYRKAFEVASPDNILAIVQRQYAEILAAHNRVKALRDALAHV